MATSILTFLLLSPLFLPVSNAVSHNPILPKAVFFPVAKDPSTLQYVARLFVGEESLTPVNLVVDLNGRHVWLESGFASAVGSHHPVVSSSLECSMVEEESITADATPKICSLQARNAILGISKSAQVNEGSFAFEFWDGFGLGSFAKIEKFLYPSAPNLLLKGLANDAKGMLGLGDSRISASSQFFRAFGVFARKFSLCLSPLNGGIFLGGGPNFGTEISIMYTPLVRNDLQGYYINVQSIKISGRKLELNQKGFLGTKISTVTPYTVLESKIYKTFLEAYVESAASMNLSTVAPVAPFGACFSSKNGRGGLNVPAIDLVLQSEMVKWRILGRNSMVTVSDGVMCLGFLDGGLSLESPVVIGGLQLEDHVLEFDLGNSMLGFSSSLLTGQKSCPGFAAKKPSFL